jgi:hypothetical protein
LINLIPCRRIVFRQGGKGTNYSTPEGGRNQISSGDV